MTMNKMKKSTSLSIAVLILFLLSFFEALAEELPSVHIHGFVSQGYMKTTDDKEYMTYGTKDGTFEFNEMGINFSTNVTTSLRIGMQLLAYDLGNFGNDEIIVDWAYADYNFRSYLGLRAGFIKIPYGLYNTQRDVDFLRTSIFLPQSVYGEYFRDAFSRIKGAGLYGELPYGFYYRTVIGLATPVTPQGGLAQTFKEVLDIEPETVNADICYAYNLEWNVPAHPFETDSIKLAASYYAAEGFEVTGTLLNSEIRWPFDTVDAFVSSIEIIYNNLIFASEYLCGHIGFLTIYGGERVGNKIDINYDRHYTSVSYRLTQWLESCLFYSVSWYDGDDKNGHKALANGEHKNRSDAWEKDLCIAFRFDLNDNWILKAETHMLNGTLHVLGDHENDTDNWFFYAVKITFSF